MRAVFDNPLAVAVWICDGASEKWCAGGLRGAVLGFARRPGPELGVGYVLVGEIVLLGSGVEKGDIEKRGDAAVC